jgi:hypothetical protein
LTGGEVMAGYHEVVVTEDTLKVITSGYHVLFTV